MFLRRLGVVVLGPLLELGRVRIGGAGHFGDPVDTRYVAVGVVEQDTVADPHVVAHGVARLVVAHAGPGLGADALQVVDREIRWFGLHQTVAFAWNHSARSEEHTTELKSLMRIS